MFIQNQTKSTVMYLSLKGSILLICLLSAGANNVTFTNVMLEGNFGLGRMNVSFSNNLRENLPKIPSEIEVQIIGSVPVLYEGAVSDIENLKVLQLKHGELAEIRPGAFRNLPQLRELILTNNTLTEIRENTFSGLNLSLLDLNVNSISVLHKGAFNNSHIIHLNIRRNVMETISTGFENLDVMNLDLGINWIRKIEVGAFSAMNLKELTLEYNELSEFDPEIFNFAELTYLDLKGNFIKNLQPNDLKNLPKLKKLDLSGNKITHIPEGLFTSLNLEALDISANNISSISSKSFDNMIHLKYVSVCGTGLTKWDKNWFYNTPKLEKVYFRYTQFQEIADGAFQNLDGVKEISFESSDIVKFSPNAFVKSEGNGSSVVHISNIDLRWNKMRCIEEELKEAFRRSATYVNLSVSWDKKCANDSIGDISQRDE